MSKIWVLGAGQLGAMLQKAGLPLALDVEAVDIERDAVLPLTEDDIVTAEREHWPETAATQQLAAHPHFFNGAVFGRLADRYTQKQLLDQLSLATAPWRFVDEQMTAVQLHQALGERVLLKRRTGGYDGKGQHWLVQSEGSQIPDEWHQQAIAEQAIAFDEEVSLVGARDQHGNCWFYPLTLNLHQNGILMASVSPLARLQPLQAQAEKMLTSLMDDLNYVGVMAMECFRVGDQLLINEIAPRVHNSGHWTQAGATINQFESHLRAVTGLPMSKPLVKQLTVMVNLIGLPRDNRWLEIAGVELYWYNKYVRPGRKVGHINICADLPQQQQALLGLGQLLPNHYQEAIEWLLGHLE